MFSKLLKSSIFNSWFSNFVILFSSLIAIPIVIMKLQVEEINLWFLFTSVVAISQGALFGFNGTFVRFVAYSFSGVKISEFRNLRFKNELKHNDIADAKEFSKIFFLMKRVYHFLSIIYLSILLLLGVFALDKPIQSLDEVSSGWIAWSIIVASTTLTLTFGYYQVFLEGINKVALVQRILGIVNLIGLFFILGVLFIYPTLISIVLVYQLITVCATVIVVYFAKKELISLTVDKSFDKFDKELFSIVWESAWKSGITTIIANVVKHISAILVSQLFTPAISASFLFTKRIFDILERFTMTTFQARIPAIAQLRGRGDIGRLIPFLKQTQYISYGVFLIGYLIFIIAGDKILSLIKSNVAIGNYDLIILFSFSAFFTRWAGMTLATSNQANHVVEHIIITTSSIVFFIIIFLFYDVMTINVFPFAQMISMIVIIPIIAKQVYSTLHTSFLKYEKFVLFPIFGLLLLINLIYYFEVTHYE